jgi:spore coat polysaccharide biosynthesis protein SpsF (cytidylyltransferase family)/aryl-alcohol dehydrogenase-like predicted oxidoreductase
MRVVVIIQARTASTRLPGKAMLPVAGYPTAILAALRGSNRNHRTIFATSDDPSDDRLATEAGKHGLEVFRGPLQDVLARYSLAAASLPEDSIVVRLTADNVLPDGRFVEELARGLECSGAEYSTVEPHLSKTPYGLFGEAFLVAALRKADSQAVDAADREHVGPWMKRNCRRTVLAPLLAQGEDFGHLRCTIDTEEDYQRILNLFAGVSNPLESGWLELVRELPAVAGRHPSRIPCRWVSGNMHSELTLGTAQLGMEYGRVNDSGKPSRAEAVAVVRSAIERGVTGFDTARAYGESESVLGEALGGIWRVGSRVITKVDLSLFDKPRGSGKSTGDEWKVRRQVDESVDASCRALRSEALDTVLLHLWEHRQMCDGAAWRRLLEHRDAGKVAAIGVSVYEPHQAVAALCDEQVKHLQIPLNVLDWRWKAAGVDRAIADRPDVVVHARSVLLQGILAHPSERWPEVTTFDGASCARKLLGLSQKFRRDGVVDLCLAYVRSLAWITSLVVGCETVAQLEKNVELFLKPRLTAEECEELEHALPKAPDSLLNPSKWQVARARMGAYAS